MSSCISVSEVYNSIFSYKGSITVIFFMLKNDIIFSAIRVPADFVLLVCAGMCAYALRTSGLVAEQYPVLSLLDALGVFALSALFLIAVMVCAGLYNIQSATKMVREAFWVASVLSGGMALIVVILFFQLVSFESKFILVVGWIFAIVFVVLGRIGIQALHLHLIKKYSIGRKNILIIGAKQHSHSIRNALLLKYKKGVSIVGEIPSLNFELLRTLHGARSIHQIIIATPQHSREAMVQLISFCENNGIQFSYTPDLFDSLLADMDFDIVNGIPIVSVNTTALRGWQLGTKRIVDIAGAVVLLALLCVPFCVVAFFIKWESRGPVFLRTTRMSQNKQFQLYKFRSMIHNAHKYKTYLQQYNERNEGPFFKMTNDPRITKIGHILRKTRIDELPQLFNVLKGEMSLVGPRPHEPEEVAHYQTRHRKVFIVKSGITGFSQVSGAQNLAFEEEIRLDRYYIEHWSLKLDIIILIKTLLILLFRHDGV